MKCKSKVKPSFIYPIDVFFIIFLLKSVCLMRQVPKAWIVNPLKSNSVGIKSSTVNRRQNSRHYDNFNNIYIFSFLTWKF